MLLLGNLRACSQEKFENISLPRLSLETVLTENYKTVAKCYGSAGQTVYMYIYTNKNLQNPSELCICSSIGVLIDLYST